MIKREPYMSCIRSFIGNGQETCINSLRAELDCDIYITGSSARRLSGELAPFCSAKCTGQEDTHCQ